MADAATSTSAFNALTEATIPAAALMLKGFFEAAGKLPEPDDFENANTGALWEAILAVNKAKRPVTRVNVQRELREMGWDDAKAFAALSAANVTYMRIEEALAAVQEVLDRKLRRQAMRVASEALNDLKTVHNVQESVSRIERSFSDLASQSLEADGWVDFKDVKDAVTQRLPSGIDDLDRKTGGIPVAELTIIGGATGMGKSSIASVLALNVARHGYGVAYFSLEMGTTALLNRMAATAAYQPARLASGRTPNPYYEDFELNRMNREELRRFLTAREEVRGLPIKSDERRGLKLEQIRLGARRARILFERAGIPMKMLIVDHIGKVKPDRFTGNRTNDLGDVTECLAVIGKDLDVAAVGLSQLRRKDERNPDQRPSLHDLRDSGNIEQDAHTVYLVHRPGRLNDLAKDRGEDPDDEDLRRIARERFVMEVDVAKNRGGAIGRIPLFCEIGANAILSNDDPRVPLTAQGREL